MGSQGLRSCGGELTARPAMMGSPKGGMGAPCISGCDTGKIWHHLLGPGGLGVWGGGFRKMRI